jgi:hypothetical protein
VFEIFDHTSSDGGALLLKAADRRYGLIACMADCLRDERQAGKVDHSLKEVVAQRVFSIGTCPSSYAAGMLVAFTPHATNTAAHPTLAV